MKNILFIAVLSVFLTGCTHSWFKINYSEDLSQKEGFREWIGKEIKTHNGELLIIHKLNYDASFIVVPFWQLYPTIEEFKKHGKKKLSFFSGSEIEGVVPVGEHFTIQSIGLYKSSPTIGNCGVILIKSKTDGREYYLEHADLFSIKGNSIDLHDYYLELVPPPKP